MDNVPFVSIICSYLSARFNVVVKVEIHVFLFTSCNTSFLNFSVFNIDSLCFGLILLSTTLTGSSSSITSELIISPISPAAVADLKFVLFNKRSSIFVAINFSSSVN